MAIPTSKQRHRAKLGEPATDEGISGTLEFVDALASLAAELWFAGKLDHVTSEDSAHVDDE